MKPIKILHTSDLHIDWPFEKFSVKGRERRRRELFMAFENLCDLAISTQVDLLLVAGDLFHTDKVDRHTVALVISGLAKLRDHGIKAVILPGNHDPGVAETFRKNGGLPPNVYIFAGDNWQVYSEVAGLTIYGHPYTQSKNGARVLPDLQLKNDSGFSVGVLHGSVSGLTHVEGEYFPVTPQEIADSGLDYLALGHFHNYRDCSSGQTLASYPGSPERLSFNNVDERAAVLVTLDDGGVIAQPVALKARSYQTIDVELGQKDLPEIYLALQSYSDSELVARFNLTGMISEEDIPSIAHLEQHFRHSFFHLDIIDNTVLMPKIDSADRTVKGVFIRKILSRLNDEATSPEEKKVLREALKTGLTVLEGGKL